MTKEQAIKELKDLQVDFDESASAKDIKAILENAKVEASKIESKASEIIKDIKKEGSDILNEVEEEIEEVKEEIKVCYSEVKKHIEGWITKDKKIFTNVHEAAKHAGELKHV